MVGGSRLLLRFGHTRLPQRHDVCVRTHGVLVAGLSLIVAAASCTSTTPPSADGSSATATTSIQVKVITPSPCPGTDCGIPTPDCEGDAEAVGTYDHSTGVVVNDVETDVNGWAQTLVGGGATSGIPTPPNAIAFLVRRGGSDLALLWYRSDGGSGWIRDRYVACESALSR